jgi:hypothetical protein
VTDSARTKRAADEIEQASLVPDVTHSREYRVRALSRPSRANPCHITESR